MSERSGEPTDGALPPTGPAVPSQWRDERWQVDGSGKFSACENDARAVGMIDTCWVLLPTMLIARSSLPVWLRLVTAVPLALVALWLSVRTARLRFEADFAGLFVRNLVHTYHVRWSDVAAFEDGAYPSYNKPWALRIVLQDGRALEVLASAKEYRASATLMSNLVRLADVHHIDQHLTGIRPERRSRFNNKPLK